MERATVGLNVWFGIADDDANCKQIGRLIVGTSGHWAQRFTYLVRLKGSLFTMESVGLLAFVKYLFPI